ncbi:MAG TPA: FtsX-like permease family protein, partial [Anaerolineaceae bacterium]
MATEAPAGLFLYRIGWRYLVRHGVQTALMVLGIALGVAVVVSIDLANASAEQAFTLSTQAVAGKATHQITGGPRGLDEHLYLPVKTLPGVTAAAPVISEDVTSPQLGSQPLQLLGVDPFAENPFRNYLGSQGSFSGMLTGFLTRPGAVIISAGNASRYGLKIGDSATLMISGKHHVIWISGLLDPVDPLSKQTADGLILADISTAQELTGRLGRLDRIDLILPSNSDPIIGNLKQILPQDAVVAPAGIRQGSIEQMTSAFRTNLTALSLLALLVGLFLIYNSMTFSVVQRRGLFGTLRCLGVTRREVFALVLSEAFLVGLLGGLLGIALGLAMGIVTVRMVTQTVNDLYFTTTVQSTGINPLSLLKGAGLGLLATMITAALPAWEASTVPPRAALLRSGLEV